MSLFKNYQQLKLSTIFFGTIFQHIIFLCTSFQHIFLFTEIWKQTFFFKNSLAPPQKSNGASLRMSVDMEMCRWIFQGLTEIHNGCHWSTLYFCGRKNSKSETIANVIPCLYDSSRSSAEIVIYIHDLKSESWLSEVEHHLCRSWKITTILKIYKWASKIYGFPLKPEQDNVSQQILPIYQV